MKISVLLYLFVLAVSFCFMQASRLSSAPFVSCAGFRNVATFLVDEEKKIYNPKMLPVRKTLFFNPKHVKTGDVIYVNLAYLKLFFTLYHPYIEHKYILISSEHDLVAPGKFARYLIDDKIFAWFTQNCSERNNLKVIPIPIGIFDRCYLGEAKFSVFCKLSQQSSQKKYLLYANFCEKTTATRCGLLDFFRQKSFCKVALNLSYEDYLSDLACSKFVVSPFGNGLDCYRTWEILAMGSFPIVLSSSMNRLFDELPVLIVDDWECLTQEFLEKKYDEMASKQYNMRKIYIDYWVDLIRSYQARCREAEQKDDEIV